jgi:A/G-specific adenine glycosylase
MLLLLNPEREIYLEQRPARGVWGGLWSFPQFDTHEELAGWCDQRILSGDAEVEVWPAVRHTFSHFHLDITPVYARLGGYHTTVMEDPGRLWYNTAGNEERGLAAPVEKLLQRLSEQQEQRDRHDTNRKLRKTG